MSALTRVGRFVSSLTRWLACGAVTLGIGSSACTTSKIPASPTTAIFRPEVRTGYATTPDGVRLWYRVVGSGAQTVILSAASHHQDAFDALATPTRKVVLYDIRGRGKTDSVAPDKSGIVEFDARDIDVIREAVGADSIALIGWTGGALSVFRFALANPSRVTRFILLTPVGPRSVPWWDDMRVAARSRVDTAATARLQARVRAGEFANDEAGLCREEAKMGAPKPSNSGIPRRAPDVCDLPNEWPTQNRMFVGQVLAKLGQYDWRSDLSRVTVPRLVIHGEMDNPPLGGKPRVGCGPA